MSRNQPDHLLKLLQDKADPNVAWPDGMTGLHVAAMRGFVSIAKVLVDNGATIDAEDDCGCTPLYLAARSNQLQFFNYLLSQKSSVNLANNEGYTPLHVAARYGHTTIISALFNPLHVQPSGREELCSEMSRLEINNEETKCETTMEVSPQEASCPITCIANIDACTNDGCTSLSLAARFGHLETVNMLLEQTPDVEIEDNSGKQALHEAASNNHKKIVDALLNYGAHPSSQTNEGEMPCCISKDPVIRKSIHQWIAQPGVTIRLINKWRRETNQVLYFFGLNILVNIYIYTCLIKYTLC